jgi:hypothetical protein
MSRLIDKAQTLTGVAMAPFVMALVLATAPFEQVQAQGASVSNVIEVTGEVAVVDKENRTLTLIDGEGNARNIAAPEEARNFDQIKRGDTLTIAYVESIEVFLAEPGSAPAIEESSVAEQAEAGEMPAGVVAQAVQVSATITAIDKENRVLTLLTEDGSEVQKEVSPDVAAFDSLKVGDTIAVRISRVLAVEVERPEAE